MPVGAQYRASVGLMSVRTRFYLLQTAPTRTYRLRRLSRRDQSDAGSDVQRTRVVRVGGDG